MDWEGLLVGCIVNDAWYKDFETLVEFEKDLIQYQHEIGHDVRLHVL